MKLRTLLCLILCLGMAGQIFAQEPEKEEEEEIIISTDRPGMTFSPTTVPKGFVQIEYGLGLDLTDSMDSWGVSVMDFRYGLAKNFELRAGLRANAVKDWRLTDMGFEGTLLAGFKWLIVDKKVQLTYMAEAAIPIYPTIVNAYHMINLAHPIGEKVAVSYMVLHNYNFSQLGTAGYGGDLQLAVNITFALTDKWAFYIGGTPMWDSADPTVWQVLYDAGITYLVKKNIQLDLFFGHGINYKHGTYGLGVSWLPMKERKFAPAPAAGE